MRGLQQNAIVILIVGLVVTQCVGVPMKCYACEQLPMDTAACDTNVASTEEGGEEEYHQGERNNSIASEQMNQKMLQEQIRGLPDGYQRLITLLLQGNSDEAGKVVIEQIEQELFGDLQQEKELVIQLIVIAMIAAIFSNLSGSFQNGIIGETGGYVTYLLSVMLLCRGYFSMVEIAKEIMQLLLDSTRTLIPVYMLSISAAGGISSSFAYYEMLLIGISMVEQGILYLVLPMIDGTVMLMFMNQLSKEDRFSKIAELLKLICNWVLKAIAGIVISMNLLKGLIHPSIDVTKLGAIRRGIAMLPGGKSISSFAEIVIGSGELIKNCIGVGGMMFLVAVVGAPICKLILIVLLYRVTGALLQPVTDKQMLQGIHSVSEGGSLLVSCVMTATVLLLVSIAVIAMTTNGLGTS